MKVGKLVIGIISLVLFLVIELQSCAAGISNTLSENGESSGFAGGFVGIIMLIAGIIGITTRSSKGGGITAGIFYLIAGLIGITGAGSFADLAVWGWMCVIFGTVFIVGSINMKKTKPPITSETE